MKGTWDLLPFIDTEERVRQLYLPIQILSPLFLFFVLARSSVQKPTPWYDEAYSIMILIFLIHPFPTDLPQMHRDSLVVYQYPLGVRLSERSYLCP